MTPNTTIPVLPLVDEFRGLPESESEASPSLAAIPAIDDVKRNSQSGIAQMVLQLTMPPMPPSPSMPRVGGRHRTCPPRREGGGYQDNCDLFETRPGVKKSDDPRLHELAVMGLPGYWLQVAEYLGVDTFLGMWRILDANKDNIAPAKGSYSYSMSLTLRSYGNYLRFQKNRYVETLASQGLAPKEIQRRVQTQLCEYISIVHIRRLSQKNKIKQ